MVRFGHLVSISRSVDFQENHQAIMAIIPSHLAEQCSQVIVNVVKQHPFCYVVIERRVDCRTC